MHVLEELSAGLWKKEYGDMISHRKSRHGAKFRRILSGLKNRDENIGT